MPLGFHATARCSKLEELFHKDGRRLVQGAERVVREEGARKQLVREAARNTSATTSGAMAEDDPRAVRLGRHP